MVSFRVRKREYPRGLGLKIEAFGFLVGVCESVCLCFCEKSSGAVCV